MSFIPRSSHWMRPWWLRRVVQDGLAASMGECFSKNWRARRCTLWISLRQVGERWDLNHSWARQDTVPLPYERVSPAKRGLGAVDMRDISGLSTDEKKQISTSPEREHWGRGGIEVGIHDAAGQLICKKYYNAFLYVPGTGLRAKSRSSPTKNQYFHGASHPSFGCPTSPSPTHHHPRALGNGKLQCQRARGDS
ncbi:hypothetical protein BDZ45DRAFT_96917 [Acephala macrosclerotiorum]|nr:hypothetical protein BDZ45DRAFT_96917 [Acephala macrosclerotiorum]